MLRARCAFLNANRPFFFHFFEKGKQLKTSTLILPRRHYSRKLHASRNNSSQNIYNKNTCENWMCTGVGYNNRYTRGQNTKWKKTKLVNNNNQCKQRMKENRVNLVKKIAFCRHSKKSVHNNLLFGARLFRLFSLLFIPQYEQHCYIYDLLALRNEKKKIQNLVEIFDVIFSFSVLYMRVQKSGWVCVAIL